MTDTSRVVLIGFSGGGKSTVAHLLADRLGWRAVDTDADIERVLGMSVPAIFNAHGESYFRELERRALLTALDADRVVVATGGGAVVDPLLWDACALRRPGTLVVALDAEPETMLVRLREQQAAEGEVVERPMLAGDDPLTRIRELKSHRQPVYDRADITLIVDGILPADVAAEIASLLPRSDAAPAPALRLDAASASSDVFIDPGVSAKLGDIIASRWPGIRHAWVISDESVGSLHGQSVLTTLDAARVSVEMHTVGVGETSKSWQTAGTVLDWLLDEGIERGDLVIALGGGVIGDLAGFVAASVLRGVPLMQIPTSLLAMVDSSIGGKTGINHRAGKNLIGAFYQPHIVVIDPRFLVTLPPRELNAGWAEIVKHAIIQPSTPNGERSDLLRFLERNGARLRSLSEPATSYAIRRNVALKAAVVEADERETGIRAYLNFGHTLGHAIEAADYQLLHGEAVAVGIRAVMRLAAELGPTDENFSRRVDSLLDAFDLPAFSSADESRVLARLGSDKKRVAGRLRWVVPIPSGGVAIRDDIPNDLVRDALRQVTSPTAPFSQT